MERLKINDLLDDIKKTEMPLDDIAFLFLEINSCEVEKGKLNHYVSKFGFTSADLKKFKFTESKVSRCTEEGIVRHSLDQINKHLEEIRKILERNGLHYSRQDFR